MGTFVRAEILGRHLEDAVVLPRHVLRRSPRVSGNTVATSPLSFPGRARVIPADSGSASLVVQRTVGVAIDCRMADVEASVTGKPG